MKIVSLQLPVRLSDVAENMKVFCDAVSQLSGGQDTIVILPEMWMCGFDYERLGEFSEKTEDAIKAIQGIIDSNTLVISALPEKNQNKVFNTTYAVTKDGVLGKHRKNFLFSPLREDEYFDKGSDICVVDFKGVNVGLLVCYEIRFPELFRLTSFAGAEIIVLPAIWGQIKKEHWLTLLRARAIENQCYIAGGNTSVMHGKKDMACGFSATIDPWGEFLFEPSAAEGVYTAEADLDTVKDIRTKIPSFFDAREVFDIKRRN